MSENNGLLDRLARVEGTENEIIETIQAISQVVGAGEVQVRLGAIKRDKMAQWVAEMVKNGKVESTDAVTEAALVVGQQTDKGGNVIFPGRFQVPVSDMLEDIRKAIVGKKVGDSMALADGSSLKISEVYVPATAKSDVPKKVPKAKRAKGPTPPAQDDPAN